MSWGSSKPKISSQFWFLSSSSSRSALQDQRDAGFVDPSRVFSAVHPLGLQPTPVVLSSQPSAVTETVVTLPTSCKAVGEKAHRGQGAALWSHIMRCCTMRGIRSLVSLLIITFVMHAVDGCDPGITSLYIVLDCCVPHVHAKVATGITQGNRNPAWPISVVCKFLQFDVPLKEQPPLTRAFIK